MGSRYCHPPQEQILQPVNHVVPIRDTTNSRDASYTRQPTHQRESRLTWDEQWNLSLLGIPSAVGQLLWLLQWQTSQDRVPRQPGSEETNRWDMQRLDWFTHKIEAIQYNFTSRWLPKSSKSGTSPQLLIRGSSRIQNEFTMDQLATEQRLLLVSPTSNREHLSSVWHGLPRLAYRQGCNTISDEDATKWITATDKQKQ